MKISNKQSKKRTIFLIISSLILIAFIMLHYFFPSFHYEIYKGIEYYSNESYTDFGMGFNRYGKIASKYLPEYEKIAEDATYLDFSYYDSNFGIYKYVFIGVGVRYDTEHYLAERDEILQMGTDFGQDELLSTYETRHYRLIEQEKRINGERLYYVIGCSDVDHAIMYLVYFDNDRAPADKMSSIANESGMIHTEFWQDLHPITANEDHLSPKI